MKRILFIIVSLFIFWTADANDIYEVTATSLSVRVSPSIKAKAIGNLTKGDRLEVIDFNKSGWAKVEYRNRIGYVSTRFLKFVQQLQDNTIEKVEVESNSTLTKDSEDEIVMTAQQNNAIPKVNNEEFSTLLNGPGRISRNFELYYGLSVGAGFSSFMWDGELVNGRVSYTADIFVELDITRKQSYLNGCFAELQIGYDAKGAAWYPMSYVHMRLFPFGYKYNIYPVKLAAKLGLYLGYPLSELESYNSWECWSGDFQVGLSAAIGVEYKQFGIYANVDYNFTEVASTPTTLNNIAIFGTFSYKFGKLKH